MNRNYRLMLLKQAAMNKRALDPGGAVYLLAAATALATFGVGAAAGYATAKASEPGNYDQQNIQKQYMLQRLKRDNRAQQAALQREQAQRQMRDKTVKPVRVFG